jgi:RNA polymerase sigma-70 factor (ECF subfamily)
LHKTLQGLNPRLRVVFVLRDIEELSLEQTAEALGLSVAAVKSRSWRARMQLRERLTEYFHRSRGSADAANRPTRAGLGERERSGVSEEALGA